MTDDDPGPALRTAALEELLVERGLVDPAVVDAATDRWGRISRNELLNTVAFFFAGSVMVNGISTNYDEGSVLAFLILAMLFSVFRQIYTIAYAYAFQPFRTVAFALGLLTTLIIAFWGMFLHVETVDEVVGADPTGDVKDKFELARILMIVIGAVVAVTLAALVALNFVVGAPEAADNTEKAAAVEDVEAYSGDDYTYDAASASGSGSYSS